MDPLSGRTEDVDPLSLVSGALSPEAEAPPSLLNSAFQLALSRRWNSGLVRTDEFASVCSDEYLCDGQQEDTRLG
jgi:hypothetical protein